MARHVLSTCRPACREVFARSRDRSGRVGAGVAAALTWGVVWLLAAPAETAHADADHALLSRLGDAIAAEQVPAVSEALERVLARWPKERDRDLAGAFACIDVLLTEGRLGTALQHNRLDATADTLTRLRASLRRCIEDGPPRIDRGEARARAAALARAAPSVAELVALQAEVEQRLQGDYAVLRQVRDANAARLGPIRAQLQATAPESSELWPRIRAIWRALDPPEATRADLAWPRQSAAPAIATVMVGAVPVVLAIPVLGGAFGMLPAPWAIGAGAFFGVIGSLVSAVGWTRPSRGLAFAGTILGVLSVVGGVTALALGEERARWFGGGLLAGAALNGVWNLGAWLHATHTERTLARGARRWEQHLAPKVGPGLVGLSARFTF